MSAPSSGYFGEELDVYFDDLTDASERIWDVLENFKEIVEALESSNESVLSHRAQRRAARPDRGQRHPAAADPDRQHLGHERDLCPVKAATAAFWFDSWLDAGHLLIGMVLYFRRRGWL